MANIKQNGANPGTHGNYQGLPVHPPIASMPEKKLVLGAKATRGDLSGVNYENGTTFWRCQFIRARGILAPNASFIECDLKNADLWGANIPSCKMLDSQLMGVRLQESNARFGCFANAVMTKANLGYQSGGNGKNTSRAGIFSDSDFKGTNLEGANLEGCNFERTMLIAANMARTNCTDCYFSFYARSPAP